MTTEHAPPSRPRRFTRLAKLIGLAAATATLAVPAASATAGGGGVSAGGGSDGRTTEGREAKLRKGKAIPPESAPIKVKRAIRAGNEIAGKPYKYGGGHGKWNDRGYDCSGAVSYLLGRPGAKILRRPTTSGGFKRWGKHGKGKWMTVYANSGHVFIEVAGLRFDTSQTGDGDGPDWDRNVREGMANGPFERRHWGRL